MDKELTKVSKETLLLLNFNFSYITSFGYNADTSYNYFCYEYGYQAVEDGCFKLMKR